MTVSYSTGISQPLPETGRLRQAESFGDRQGRRGFLLPLVAAALFHSIVLGLAYRAIGRYARPRDHLA
ncbi:hypothetical protein [Streptomyces hydrogenans]|uniref:hypothetical protein n=1 Tax=Streptomyces hydrogenans TaxID=1873719 RepID=UPI0037FBB0F2